MTREFDEYIVHGEPGHMVKAHVWQTVIDYQLCLLRIPLEYKQYPYLSYCNVGTTDKSL